MKLSDPAGQGGQKFRLQNWIVDPSANVISSGKQRCSVSPKAMDLLVFLSANAGRTVSKEELLDAVWPATFTGDEVLWRRICELRQAFGEDSRTSSIIRTIPKRGYRLEAEISPLLGEVVNPQRRSWALWAGALSVLVMLLGVAALLLWKGQNGTGSSPLPSGDSPTILVGEIQNLTNDSRLNRTLAYGLEQCLLDSGQIKIVSRSRVAELLRQMRKPPDAELTTEVATEISLRDGDINRLVMGQVSQFGERFEFGLRLIDPSSGRVLGGTTVQHTDPERFLGELRGLAVWVLRQVDGLMESGVDDTSVREVTTNSLEAYSLYLAAHQYFARHESEPVRQLLRQALSLDPEFASAHLLLAMATDYPEGSREDAIACAEKAMTYRHRAGLAERSLIQAVYLDMREDYAAAATEYEFFLKMRPDHPWAFLNLIKIYKLLNRPDQFEAFLLRAAAKEPESLGVQLRSAALLIELSGDTEGARTAIERAERILKGNSAETVDPAGTLVPFLKGYPVWEDWLNDAPAAASMKADAIRATLQSKREEIPNISRLASVLGLMYLTLGRLAEVEELIRDFHATQLYLPEFLALVKGSLSPSSYGLWERPIKHVGGLVVLELGTPVPSDLESLVLEDLQNADSYWPNNLGLRRLIHSGGFALSKGRYSEAISRLEQALDFAPKAGVWHTTAAAMVRLALARAFERSGQLDQATKVLERLSCMRRHTYISSAPLWLVCQGRLAELYRRMGDIEKAQQIEGHLLSLLQKADQDHPILTRLAERVGG